MDKVKTIVAMGALLMGAAYAASETEPSANQLEATGLYSVDVLEVAKLWLSKDNGATKTDAKDVLQTTANNTATSPLVLEFSVLTNWEHWDLELSAANGGKLLRDDGTAIRTDVVGDGSLGKDGTLYVLLTTVEKDNKVINNFKVGDAADVEVREPKDHIKLADKLSLSGNEFQNDGEVKSVFEIRAGVNGTKVIAPPGTYTETVTLNLIHNTP